jgi:hypothetical protein
MDWYKIQVPYEPMLAIADEFQRLMIVASVPDDAALFASNYFTHSLYDMYFSPAAVPHCLELIARYGGVPCDVPERADTGLYSGPQSALGLLR